MRREQGDAEQALAQEQEAGSLLEAEAASEGGMTATTEQKVADAQQNLQQHQDTVKSADQREHPFLCFLCNSHTRQGSSRAR